MSVNCEKRTLKSPGGDCHDLFGAEFIGSPCHHRVLKPPGGGSSDIFGKDGSNDEKPVIRKKSGQSSSIVLNDDVSPAPAENGHAKQDAPKTNGESLTNGKGGGFEAPKPATNAAPRQRVPPGGFSSGLW